MATSDLGQLAEAIAALLNGAMSWDTAGRAVWFPPDDRSDYGATGRSFLVVPVNREYQLDARGIEYGQHEVAIAVYQPIGTDDWNNGDAVVDAAEAVAETLLGNVAATRRCIETNLESILSRDAVRQYRLWLCQVSTVWR